MDECVGESVCEGQSGLKISARMENMHKYQSRNKPNIITHFQIIPRDFRKAPP